MPGDKQCFLPGESQRACLSVCAAYDVQQNECKLLVAVARLSRPTPSRPPAPEPPKVK